MFIYNTFSYYFNKAKFPNVAFGWKDLERDIKSIITTPPNFFGFEGFVYIFENLNII